MRLRYCALHETIGMYVCTCVWIKREYRLAYFGQFFNWFHGLSILLTDPPELRRTTQPSIMGGLSGDPGFCFFRSTVTPMWCHCNGFLTRQGAMSANFTPLPIKLFPRCVAKSWNSGCILSLCFPKVNPETTGSFFSKCYFIFWCCSHHVQ